MSLTLRILGCGSSGGVPRIGSGWGECDPANPKNRRQRCSVLVSRTNPEGGTTRVLIDTSPDLRNQALDANLNALDGVLFTHEHADHTHGIDELRAFFLQQRHRLPLWADARTASLLRTRFGYCFDALPGSDYQPIATLGALKPFEPVTITGAGGDIVALPFEVIHGTIEALGFRIGAMAYTPDVNGIPDSALSALEGLDLWVVDALRRDHHPSHFSLDEALGWIVRLKPRRAILTNLHVDMDYEALARALPANVVPGYDSMEISL